MDHLLFSTLLRLMISCHSKNTWKLSTHYKLTYWKRSKNSSSQSVNRPVISSDCQKILQLSEGWKDKVKSKRCSSNFSAARIPGLKLTSRSTVSKEAQASMQWSRKLHRPSLQWETSKGSKPSSSFKSWPTQLSTKSHTQRLPSRLSNDIRLWSAGNMSCLIKYDPSAIIRCRELQQMLSLNKRKKAWPKSRKWPSRPRSRSQ